MSLPGLRRWVLRGGAALTVLPVAVMLRFAQSPSPERVSARPVTTTSTMSARAIEVAMDMVTTTTVAPPPTTVVTAARVTTPRVTAPPTTAAPRIASVAKASLTIEERGQLALALLNYPWERLGHRVEFQGPMTGVLGETNSSTKVITIFVRDSHSVTAIARTLAHEMGHALDFSQTTINEAKQYLAIRGLPYAVADWYPCNACNDYASPAGDFAEVFAYSLLGPGDFRSEIGPAPTAEQLAQLSAIFTPN
ncbi:MAG: hypothetical protein Q8K63_07085 [Acidimicrobiales bacterium]|nr:hypothetical protein [Acidimicrobiales bacterium]